MRIENFIQVLFAGVCLYTGILHLIIGMRNQPRDTVNLVFAIISLLYGVYSINLYFLGNAIEEGSVTRFVSIDRWGLMTIYLAYAAMFWFSAVYTNARRRVVPGIIAGLYAAIALSNYILPFTWVYTDIALSGGDGPVLTLSDWYRIEGPLTPVVILLYSAAYISRYYRSGNRSASWALAAAIGIFTADC